MNVIHDYWPLLFWYGIIIHIIRASSSIAYKYLPNWGKNNQTFVSPYHDHNILTNRQITWLMIDLPSESPYIKGIIFGNESFDAFLKVVQLLYIYISVAKPQGPGALYFSQDPS